MEGLELAAIALVGILAGVVNTIVGAGTSIVLPLLVLLGVDPLVANGTNRLCVAFQTAVAAHTFHGRTGTTGRGLLWPVASATAGSIPGAWLATVLDPALFEDILGWILLAGVGLMFLRRRRGAAGGPAGGSRGAETEAGPPAGDAPGAAAAAPVPARLSAVGLAVTFIFGAYGGFVGAGIGVLFMLYLPPLLGISMVRMAHVKTWMVLALSVASGLWYLQCGLIDWIVAAPLIPSYALGGFLGARLALFGGERWLRRAVAVVAALLAVAVLADLR